MAGCGFSYPTRPESVICGKQSAIPQRFEQIGNLAVGVGDYGQRIAASEPLQNLAGARADITPVRGNASGFYHVVA